MVEWLLHCVAVVVFCVFVGVRHSLQFPSGPAVLNRAALLQGLPDSQPSELRQAVHDTRLPAVCPPLPPFRPTASEASLQHKSAGVFVLGWVSDGG